MKRLGIVVVVFTLILSGFLSPRCRAAIYDSNGTAASLQFIHDNQAQNGDTITLPAGRFVWSNRVNITKGITVQGQTTVNSDNGTANDLTVIVDNLSRVPGGQGFFHCTTAPGQRITGITFQGGSTNTMYNGAVRFRGNSPVRIDHCHFTGLYHQPYITITGAIYGVADHNLFNNFPGHYEAFYMQGAGYGDQAFAQDAQWGGSQFFFIEDNYIYSPNIAFAGGVDGKSGIKYVFRHNRVFNVEAILVHGTEGTRERGGRAIEMYNNTFTFVHGIGLDGIRSGSMLTHDNTFLGVLPPSGFHLQDYRSFFSWGASSPWLGASGNNPWDNNDPQLYQSGTATGGSQTTLIDTSKNWTPNQWVGFTVKRLSDNQIALIRSNTSNRLNVYYYTDSGGGAVWHTGDQYQIHKLLVALDQPCRGRGDLISGNAPINTVTGTQAWPHQTLEPCYSWNNIHFPGGEHINFVPGIGPNHLFVQGRDYFNDAPMPGYMPYTYPHPLVTSAGRAVVADFNGDGSPDFVLQSASGDTAIWYLHNNVLVGGDFGPTLPPGWSVETATDFDHDSHPDYALFYPSHYTAIGYMSGPTLIGADGGPALPIGWELVATADFNGDSYSDYVLYHGGTGHTAIWHLLNNVLVGGDFGPTLPPGWSLIGVADFDRDGHMDYALFHPNTGITAIWYLSGPTLVTGAQGPTMPGGWKPVATADFDGDGYPDFLLYNQATGQTAIWYLNDNVYVSSMYGPTIPVAWSLVRP